jgi:hypothetical protein
MVGRRVGKLGLARFRLRLGLARRVVRVVRFRLMAVGPVVTVGPVVRFRRMRLRTAVERVATAGMVRRQLMVGGMVGRRVGKLGLARFHLRLGRILVRRAEMVGLLRVCRMAVLMVVGRVATAGMGRRMVGGMVGRRVGKLGLVRFRLRPAPMGARRVVRVVRFRLMAVGPVVRLRRMRLRTAVERVGMVRRRRMVGGMGGRRVGKLGLARFRLRLAPTAARWAVTVVPFRRKVAARVGMGRFSPAAGQTAGLVRLAA